MCFAHATGLVLCKSYYFFLIYKEKNKKRVKQIFNSHIPKIIYKWRETWNFTGPNCRERGKQAKQLRCANNEYATRSSRQLDYHHVAHAPIYVSSFSCLHVSLPILLGHLPNSLFIPPLSKLQL